MYRQSTCPIQPHRLIIISISMGPCYVRCQSSALLMISGHCILRTHLRQVFMKVWTFLVFFLVVLHVSDPYGKTELTLELKILYLVWVAIALALHMFLKLEEGYSCLANPCFDICVSATMIVHNATQFCEGFLQSISALRDWAVVCSIYSQELSRDCMYF